MSEEEAKKLLKGYKYNELTIKQREKHIEQLKEMLKNYINRQNEIKSFRYSSHKICFIFSLVKNLFSKLQNAPFTRLRNRRKIYLRFL